MQLDPGRAITRHGAETIGNRLRLTPADARAVRIVRAIKDGAFGLNEQLEKDLLDRRKVTIKVEMLLLDIENERMLRLEKLEGPVALIAFRD